MSLNSTEFSSLKQYIQAYDKIKVERCDLEKQLIELSLSYVDDHQYDFICLIYNRDDEKDRVYIKVSGIGKLKKTTLESLDKLNDFNDISGTKIYLDENHDLVLTTSATTQMLDDEKNEWILRNFMYAVTKASLARKDLWEYIKK